MKVIYMFFYNSERKKAQGMDNETAATLLQCRGTIILPTKVTLMDSFNFLFTVSSVDCFIQCQAFYLRY
jgi:hypothetical protein